MDKFLFRYTFNEFEMKSGKELPTAQRAYASVVLMTCKSEQEKRFIEVSCSIDEDTL